MLTWNKCCFLILQGSVLTHARSSETFWYVEMRYSFLVNLTQKLLKLVNICKSCCKKFTATFLCPHSVYTMYCTSVNDKNLNTYSFNNATSIMLKYLHVDSHCFKTHLKSHLFNISFPSVWLYHWLFFEQSPWSRLCCIRLSKFIIITLHYHQLAFVGGSTTLLNKSKMADGCHIEFRKMLIFLY